MRTALFALVVALATPLPLAAQAVPAADRAAIDAAMRESAAGWGARDLDRFLGIYGDGPDVAFVTSDGIVRGKAAIRARYAKGYARQFGPDARGPADRLSFAYEDWRPVGRDHVLVMARYTLTPAGEEAKPQSGYTTLLFQRTPKGWRIVADHSS